MKLYLAELLTVLECALPQLLEVTPKMRTEGFIETPIAATYRSLVKFEKKTRDPDAKMRGELLLLVASELLAIFSAAYHSAHICVKALPATMREVLRCMPIRTARHIGRAIPRSMGWSAVCWHAGRVTKAIHLAVISDAFDRSSDRKLSDKFLRRVDRMLPHLVNDSLRRNVNVYIVFNRALQRQGPPTAVESPVIAQLDPIAFEGTKLQNKVYEGICDKLGLTSAVTQESLVNPVVDANGHTDDLESLRTWIRNQGADATTPRSRQKLAHHRLVPNLWAREALQSIGRQVVAVSNEVDDSKEATLERTLETLQLPVCPKLLKPLVDPVMVLKGFEDFEAGQTYERSAIPKAFQGDEYIVSNFMAKSVINSLEEYHKAMAPAAAVDDVEQPSQDDVEHIVEVADGRLEESEEPTASAADDTEEEQGLGADDNAIDGDTPVYDGLADSVVSTDPDDSFDIEAGRATMYPREQERGEDPFEYPTHGKPVSFSEFFDQ